MGICGLISKSDIFQTTWVEDIDDKYKILNAEIIKKVDMDWTNKTCLMTTMIEWLFYGVKSYVLL